MSFNRIQEGQSSEEERVISLARQQLARLIASCCHLARKYRTPLNAPGASWLYIYIGQSVSLGRLKIGITKNIKGREASLNASLKQCGLESDFEIFDWAIADARTIRDFELEGKKALSSSQIVGEWFRDEPEVHEWFLQTTLKADAAHAQQLDCISARGPLFIEAFDMPQNGFANRTSGLQKVIDLCAHWVKVSDRLLEFRKAN